MLTRKDFLKQTLAGAAALSLGGVASTIAAPFGKVLGANDRIRIGIIGVNSRGRGIAKGLCKLPDCEITYVCDVDERAITRCQNSVEKITGKAPKGERDLRKLLEKSDVDAVVIAMPDHWHAPAAIMAMQAGKHVYLEKPTSHNPAENDMLVRTALKTGAVVQVGNQRRSWPNVQKAIAELHAGEIGKVRYAKSWYVNARPSIGIGKEVEVLARDGKKYRGVLTRVEDTDFAVVVKVKEKPEGAKRPVMVDREYTWKYDEIKYTKYLINF